MSRDSELARPSVSSNIQRAATTLRFAGNFGFWTQLVFGVLAAVLLLLSAAGISGQTKSIQGASFSIFAATGGIIALVISIILNFRYKKIAQLIQYGDPSDRPQRRTTIGIIKLGLIANLVGMLLCIIGAEAFVGVLWQKSSSLAQGPGPVSYSPAQLILPNEILLVLANCHTIFCHYIGIVTSLWLLDRLNHDNK